MWRTADRVLLRDITLVCLAVGVVGASYGATAVTGGFPVWFPVLTGVLVLAGGAEFLFVGILAAGGGVTAAALAGLLVNARHLPFGLAVNNVVGQGWRRLLGAHLTNDETVVFALGERGIERKRFAFWACGLGILLCWPLGALIGALAGTVIPDTETFGLDAMFPAVLLALALPSLRAPATRDAALLGAAVALATAPFLPAGMPVLLALVGLVVALRKGSR